jgi:hypothetical protein
MMILIAKLFNKEYIPAYITAFAGILGIVLNIVLDIYFRRSDRKITRRERQIAALENYYLPILVRTNKLVEQLKELSSNDTKFSEIIDYLQRIKKPPIKIECLVNHTRDTLSELDKFINDNEFKYIGNFPIYQNQMKINNLIRCLYHPSPYTQMLQSDDYFNIDFIDKYNKEIENTVEYIYSPNRFYYFMLKVKKHFMHKK